VASFTALLTAFYMFRLLWLTFLTPSRMDEKTAHHVHESPFSMTGVLIVLAVLSAVGGFVHLPHYLEPLMPLPATDHALEHLEIPVRTACCPASTTWTNSTRPCSAGRCTGSRSRSSCGSATGC
jgi:NADH:ubiquinone oxidoreductase subunit 5 (subunit L)/multisubunit Na+/H+ antiporter MnhA subunit